MLYLLQSDNDSLVDYFINKVKADNDVFKFNITKDNAVSSFNKLIEYDLFSSRKLFVFYDVDFFTIKKSSLSKKAYNTCIDLLNNAIHDIVIVVKKKMLNDNLKVLDCDVEFVELMFNDQSKKEYIDYFLSVNEIEISPKLLKSLLYNLEDDLNAITSELYKLSTFENPITSNVISLLSYKSVKSNVFTLIELVVYKKYDEARSLFDRLIIEGSEPVQILGLLATQIKYIYQVTNLRTMQINRIVKVVGGSSYRVEATLKTYNNSSHSNIKSTYQKIADVDYQVKSGIVKAEFIMDQLLF